LDVQGICYEVLMPPCILQQVAGPLELTNELEVVTFHYQALEIGRGIPVLIGFLNEIEREFFARFISVSGVGPKAALKALTLPIPVIARAIDEGDLALLKSLPGIGEQRGKEVIAKLQGKVGKFALIQTKETMPQPVSAAQRTLFDAAVDILVQLEYKKSEAKQMVHEALERNPKIGTAEELLNEVYRQRRLAEAPV
jgi:Holliday junction DNA helicase RuvA